MKKSMTIEEIANGYMELFANTGKPYYFMMYHSLINLCDNIYNIDELKTNNNEELSL